MRNGWGSCAHACVVGASYAHGCASYAHGMVVVGEGESCRWASGDGEEMYGVFLRNEKWLGLLCTCIRVLLLSPWAAVYVHIALSFACSTCAQALLVGPHAHMHSW